ncbi:MAG TPA: DinB family protein [Longimicrobium sp.]|nr:DinB family protein [Longimicrobium sp.]
MKRLLTALLTLCAAPALAQENPAMSSVAGVYTPVRAYVVAAAEQMPEADYGFKPTPEVRSFGQLIGHIANAQFMICALALGETSPATQNYEQVTAKAALIEALQASNALCDRAYAQSDQAAMQVGNLFGQQRTRLGMLALNAAHDFEHYGNIVTYMRLKGMVPPSSQGN